MKHHCAAMKIRTSYKTQQPVPTASRSFWQAELNHWPGMGSVVQACRGVLGWLALLLLCVLPQAAYGQNETDSVPSNFLDFPVDEKEATHYRWITDHMHVGVRWQPFVDRPVRCKTICQAASNGQANGPRMGGRSIPPTTLICCAFVHVEK